MFIAVRLLYWLIDELLDFPDSRRSTRDPERTLKWVARRLRGNYHRGGLGRVPTAAWDVGVPAVLHFVKTAHGDESGVAFRMGQPCGFRLRLLPETGWERVRRFFGAQDVRIGEPDFDRSFIVQSDAPDKAQALLAPGVRRALKNLKRFGRITLEGGPNGFVLWTRGGPLDDLEGLCAFAKEALALGRALVQGLDTSMVVSELAPAESGRCPVCGVKIESDGRECARCRTPHHQDCWSYLGGCALFACTAGPSGKSHGGGRTSV